MKSSIKILLSIALVAILALTSCQEEAVDITPPNEEETLTPNATLTSLVGAVSKRDGSKDNIIDGANCLSIKFPVTVIVNGSERIDIYNYEDLRGVEIIFDSSDDDDDTIDIVFPITVINADHEEIQINSLAELLNLAANCRGENEEDDDIECIDFKYPIAFSVYNTDFQVIEVVTIENDKELNQFMQRVVNASVLASLNFPVNLIRYDGGEETANNNAELEQIISSVKDSCDEDDDNDYNDDDFTGNYLEDYLKECVWIVKDFRRDNEDLRDQYINYAFSFKADNIVEMTTNYGDIVEGIWQVEEVTGRGVKLFMEFNNDFPDFNLDWFVYEIEEGKVKIHVDSSNRIVLERDCNTETYNCFDTDTVGTVTACLWKINYMKREGTDVTSVYEDTRLNFFEDGSLHRIINYGTSNEQTETDGEWTSVFQQDECKMKIFGTVSSLLKGYWVTSIDSQGSTMTLTIDEDNLIILQKDCI